VRHRCGLRDDFRERPDALVGLSKFFGHPKPRGQTKPSSSNKPRTSPAKRLTPARMQSPAGTKHISPEWQLWEKVSPCRKPRGRGGTSSQEPQARLRSLRPQVSQNVHLRKKGEGVPPRTSWTSGASRRLTGAPLGGTNVYLPTAEEGRCRAEDPGATLKAKADPSSAVRCGGLRMTTRWDAGGVAGAAQKRGCRAEDPALR
jgi:hypothetical protein